MTGKKLIRGLKDAPSPGLDREALARAREAFEAQGSPYNCRQCTAPLPNEECGHKANGVNPCCQPEVVGTEALEAAILAYLGHSQNQGELVKHWGAFCDADPVPDGWQERMEAAGFIWLDKVTARDREQPFATERGIEKGGQIWRLTDKGRACLSASRGGT